MAEVSPSKEMRDMELAETDVAAGRGKIIEKATAFSNERDTRHHGKDYITLHGNRQRLVCAGRLGEGKSVTEIIVAAIALIGTAVGSLGGILAANRLTNYRIEQLEKKVDKHNSVIERITVVEVKLSEQQDDLAQLRKELKL